MTATARSAVAATECNVNKLVDHLHFGIPSLPSFLLSVLSMTGPDLPVAYVWSPTLQDVADALPANVGRSSTVHGLIRALHLADFDKAEKERECGEAANANEEVTANGSATNGTGEDAVESIPASSQEVDHCVAKVVWPMAELATPAEMRRYHEVKYVGAQ